MSLEESIGLYEMQLRQVDEALGVGGGGASAAELQQLKNDLNELLTLTKQNLLEEKRKALLAELDRYEEPEPSSSTKPEPDLGGGGGGGGGGGLFERVRARAEQSARERELAASPPPQPQQPPPQPQPQQPRRQPQPPPQISAVLKPSQADLDGLDEEVRKLEGMKCRAPHRTAAGSEHTQHHNGVIFQVEPRDSCAAASTSAVFVRVVFSHPTETSMLPCPFYMDGKCRFDDHHCKFSHGEVVALSDLLEYREPDFRRVRARDRVLARADADKLWQHAVVEDGPNEDPSKVYVRLSTSTTKEVLCLLVEQVLPLVAGGGGDGDGGRGQSDDDDESEDDEDAAIDKPVAANDREDTDDEGESFVPSSLLDRIASTSALGDWEQHTTGVASRLMQRMGYVTGTGLGKYSDGRVEPVTAMLYPAGKSLDWCMKMREAAGGGDILSVDKRLRREQAKEARKAKKAYQREVSKAERERSVFEFLNTKLGGGDDGGSLPPACGGGGAGADAATNGQKRRSAVDAGAASSSASGVGSKKPAAAAAAKAPLNKASAENLKINAFKISEDIARTEKDILRLKTSLQRNEGKDQTTAAGIQAKIQEKQAFISQLKSNEKKVKGEQSVRKDRKKLAIF